MEDSSRTSLASNTCNASGRGTAVVCKRLRSSTADLCRKILEQKCPEFLPFRAGFPELLADNP